MKYTELSPLAKTIAIGDYLKGWLETHEDDIITPYEIDQILTENNENFTQFGTLITE